MAIPNKWGQGQLFAFSALDGNSYASDDFVGTLSGDRIGVRFHSKVKRELTFVKTSKVKPSFDVVASDVICVNTKNGKMHMIYAHTHLIIGNTDGECDVVVFTDGVFNEVKDGNVTIQDTNDGEYTAIYREGDRFAFAFGKSKDEVTALAKKGIAMNIADEKAKKLGIFEKLSLADDNKYAKLYAKFISVMKTQLYTPEGPFKNIYSTPDRLPHKKAWLWDSVFHAIGHKHIDMALAEGLLLTDFDVQEDNGFIPHMFDYASVSPITQPPVIAWGAYNLYKKSGNKKFLKVVFEKNKKFLLWCQENRRDYKDKELYTWLTGEDINCRCDESGMDNSPRFDTDSRLWAIDYSCFMANDVRYMRIIAEELGDSENAKFFGDWYEKIKADINEHLWCVEDKFYYDYDLNNKRLHKIQAVSSFLPLFAGICDEDKAKALYDHLTNPETFCTPFPVPSISKKDATFGSDMWRGPVWINYNYMIAEGLDAYGFSELAREIRLKTVDTVNTWYMHTGTVYEFYDCENMTPPAAFQRKGDAFEPYDFAVRAQSIRDYGWSNTLTFDLLNTYIK